MLIIILCAWSSTESDLYNLSICQKEEVEWQRKENTTFSVIQGTRKVLGILRKVSLTGWVELGVAAGPVCLAHGGQPPCQSPVINCSGPPQVTAQRPLVIIVSPVIGALGVRWTDADCDLSWHCSWVHPSAASFALRTVWFFSSLLSPAFLVAATLLHHCFGTAYEIIVDHALVL